MVTICLVLQENCQTVAQHVCIILHSDYLWECVATYPHQHFVLLVFWIFAIQIGE